MKTIVTLLFIVPLFLFESCSRNEPQSVSKHEPPVIISLSADKDTINYNEFTKISCSAYDPEGSHLKYVWTTEAGKIISDTSANVNWLGFAPQGTYQITCTVVNIYGSQASKTINLHVINSYSHVTEYSFLVHAMDGIVQLDTSGKAKFYLQGYDYYGIDVFNGHFFVQNGKIEEYDKQGMLVNTVIIPVQFRGSGWFSVLSDSVFAFFDNVHDSIYFINSRGDQFKSVGMMTESNEDFQNVGGIVVDNFLIVSDNGKNQLLKVDLDYYNVSIFKDFSDLNYWLGAIYYYDGIYYICQFSKIWAFIDAPGNSLIQIADVHVGSIYSIAVVNNYAYVAIGQNGRIYKINIFTGEFEVFTAGLNYPDAIKVWIK